MLNVKSNYRTNTRWAQLCQVFIFSGWVAAKRRGGSRSFTVVSSVRVNRFSGFSGESQMRLKRNLAAWLNRCSRVLINTSEARMISKNPTYMTRFRVWLSEYQVYKMKRIYINATMLSLYRHLWFKLNCRWIYAPVVTSNYVISSEIRNLLETCI